MAGRVLTGAYPPPVGTLLDRFGVAIRSISGTERLNGRSWGGSMPCMATSCHTSCSNYGIISFPTVKQRILGDQNCFALAKMTPIRRLTSPFWTLPGLKIEPVVPLLSQNNVAFITMSGTEPSKNGSYGLQCPASLLLFAGDAYNGLLLCGRMPFMPILCHTSC